MSTQVDIQISEKSHCHTVTQCDTVLTSCSFAVSLVIESVSSTALFFSETVLIMQGPLKSHVSVEPACQCFKDGRLDSWRGCTGSLFGVLTMSSDL